MRMLASAALALTLLTASPAAAAPERFTVDTEHADVVFLVSHLGFSDTIGRFNQVDGELMLDEGNPENSSIRIVIQAESVDTNHQKRDEHLRGPDFFNAGSFPEIVFESTKVTRTGDSTATVEGTLTMLGIERAVALDTTFNKRGQNPFAKKVATGLSARGSINRSDWGMRYGLPGIGDAVELILEMEFFLDE